MSAYFQDHFFYQKDFPDGKIHNQFDGCTFYELAYNNGDLSGAEFVNCTFNACDLSMAKLEGTVFREVTFKGCKMLGMPFDRCNNFILSFSFKNCILDFSCFNGLSIKQTLFENCSLKGAFFLEANMEKSVFKHTNLQDTAFEGTQLKGADFRTALHFRIDPDQNDLKNARFSPENLEGLLYKYGLRIG